jgi:hypothetical protein
MNSTTYATSSDVPESVKTGLCGNVSAKDVAWPKRRLVNSSRNSECSMPLDRLDWSRWFTDGGERVYLHVHSLDGDTIHRVYSRHDGPNRICFDHGKLWWLLDCPKHLEAAFFEVLRQRIAANTKVAR